MKRISSFLLLSLFVLIVIGSWLYRSSIRDFWWRRNQPALPPAARIEDKEGEEIRSQVLTEEEVNANQPVTPQETEVVIPNELNLSVPFTSQAPFARWDHFDEEMCEEASLVMVNRFYQKRGFSSKDDAQDALKEIQKWEEEHLGVWKSTPADQVASIAKELLKYPETEVSQITDWRQVKKELAAGHPVILPAAGRELENPNFKQPGPLFHMLVVRGWLKDGKIITNDPGTRLGEGYIYDPEVLWAAIHDWNGGDVMNGDKVMIVLK